MDKNTKSWVSASEQELVERYIKLAVYLAKKFRQMYLPNMRDELLSEAMFGLTKAIKANKTFESMEHERHYFSKTIAGTIMNWMNAQRHPASLIPETVRAPDKGSQFEVEEVLASLEETDRKVVELRMQGMTVREIAEIQGTYHVAIVRQLASIGEKLKWLKESS